MKGNFNAARLDEKKILLATLYVGKFLPKCGFAACEHHHDARVRARTIAFNAHICIVPQQHSGLFMA